MKRFYLVLLIAFSLLDPAFAQQMNSSLLPTPPGLVLGAGLPSALANPANANGGVTLLNGTASIGDCLVWGNGIADLGAPCAALPIGTNALKATGAQSAATLADRATSFGLDLDVVADFGAKCDGAADDAPAINAALSAAGSAAVAFGNGASFTVRLPAGRLCRAASTINASGSYAFTLDLGGLQPGYPVRGGGILCDASVSPCVALGNYAVNGTANLRNGSVTRSGTPATGTVGIAVYGYHDTLNNVSSSNSAIDYQFKSDNAVGVGGHAECYACSASAWTDAAIDDSGFPELYWFGGRIGSPGDPAGNTYIRTEGPSSAGAAAPGTMQFIGAHFNTAGPGVTHFWEFVNLPAGAPTADATTFAVIGGHVEGMAPGGAIFYSDSTWNAIDRMALDSFVINAPSTSMFALNSATQVAEWDISNVLMEVSDVTLAPAPSSGAGFANFRITGGRHLGAMHLTGTSGSTASIAGLEHGGNFTLDGAWGAFSAFGETYSAGSFIDNVTSGSVVVDNAGGRNILKISPSSGQAALSLAPANGVNSVYWIADANPNHVIWQMSSSGGYGTGSVYGILDGYNSYTVAFELYEGGNWKLGESATSVGTVQGLLKLGTVFSAAGVALPSCNSAAAGTIAYVSDAASPTYNGAYASGGSVKTLVVCNGSNWTTH